MTVFLVVLGLAMGALLLMRAAALVARPERGGGEVADRARAVCDAPNASRHISRSAGVRRSFFHALRAPGLLCERALISIVHGVIARRAALRALASARLSADMSECAPMPARSVVAPG